MTELCRICFRPTTIQDGGCPCWGDGSSESELECFRLGLAHRDAQLANQSADLAKALARAEAADFENKASRKS